MATLGTPLTFVALKKTIAILMMIVLCLQFFYKAEIYLYYQVNNGYVAEVLCENRSNTQSHCHGKCFLMKQMSDHEKNIPARIAQIQDILFFLDVNRQAAPARTMWQAEFAIEPGKAIADAQVSIFHPPPAA